MRALWIAALAALLPALACSAWAAPRFELADAYWVAGPAPNATGVVRVVVRYAGPAGNASLSATLEVLGVGGRNLSANASYSGLLSPNSTLGLDFSLSLPGGPFASFYPARLTVACNGSEESFDFQLGFGGQPRFSVSASPLTLRKGEANRVTILLRVSDAPVRNLEVRTAPAGAFVTVIGGSLTALGIVGAGSELQIPLTLQVESAAGESVAVAVTISYEDFGRRPGTQTLTVGFQVVRARGSPSLSCSLSPSRIPSGQRTYATLAVTNVGASAARDVRVSVASLSPGVALLSGSSAYLGDLAPGESRSVGLLLRADRTAVGVAQLQVSISYYDESGDARAATVSVGFEVARSPQPLLSVTVLNSSLSYGLAGRLVVRVENLGDGRALDAVVDAVPGEGLYILSSARAKLGALDPGASALVAFLARAEAVGGSVTATFRLRYYDEYGYGYEDAIRVSVNVTGRRPHVLLEALNRTLSPNRVNRVVLRVTNIGACRARNVTLTLTSQSPEIGAVLGPSTLSLGSLDPNASATAAFDVFIQPRVYGALQLLAAVAYGGEGLQSFRDLYTVGFEVRGDWELSVAAAATVPPVVFPGDDLVQLLVTVVNTGDYMARDVEVRFVGDEWVRPVSEGAARALIPYLPVGQAVTLTFLVRVGEGAPVGNHRLLINFSGRPAHFTLTVLERARFVVANASSLRVVRGGRGYRLVYVVENASNSTAEDVRVELFSPFVTGTTSAYLGKLYPHERKLAVFEVDVDPAAPTGPLTLDVKVSWTQQQRGLSQYARSLLLVEEPRSPPWPLIAAAAGALVAGALVLRGSRERLSAALKRLRRAVAV